MRAFTTSAVILSALFCLWGCSKEETGKLEEPGPAPAIDLEIPELAGPAMLGDLTIAPGDGQAVSLRYQPQERVDYDVALEQFSAQDRAGRKMEMGTAQSFVLKRALVKREEKQWTSAMRITDLEVETLGNSKDASMNEGVKAIKQALLTLQLRVTLDAVGTVHEVSVDGGDTQRMAGLNDVMEQLVRDSVVTLPEKPVAPGDSWPSKRDSLLKTRKSSNKIEYVLSSKFLGYAQGLAGCERCAVVHTEGTFTLTGAVSAPVMKGTSAGLGRMYAVVVLDVERGRLFSSETASVTRQRFDLEGRDGKLTIFEDQRNKVSQSLAKPDEKPAAKKEKE